MKRLKRLYAWLLALALLAPGGALALTGQNYATFLDYYKADVTFINENDGRHLLPMVLSQRRSGSDDGRVYYDLLGDVLTVTVTADSAGVIETCEIRLTAPAGMTYGSTVYNDFAISGYHSYAFLMAMDAGADPAGRYALVTDVVQGMKDTDGRYERQTGAYTLTCVRVDNLAVISFQNNGVPNGTATPVPDSTPAPDASPTDAPADADDFIG